MKKIKIDKDWKYIIKDMAPRCPEERWGGAKSGAYGFGATSFECDEKEWKDIDLPYDYVREGTFSIDTADTQGMGNIPEMQTIRSRLHAGGCLEPKVAWFRKHFKLDQNDLSKNIILKFDGVYRNCDVYLNEKYVGSYRNGYTFFYFEITDFLKEGENILCVRVDPRQREGWWYEGGGIYRHVWLCIYDDILILPYETGVETGIKDDTKSAFVEVTSNVVNRACEDRDVNITYSVTDAKGTIVAEKNVDLSIKDWAKERIFTRFELETDKYRRWDVEDPYLYTLKTKITDKTKDESYQLEDISFGIKDVKFTPEDGMYLNGRRLEVKGLCAHQDHAGVGIAMPDSVIEYRLREMKKMGMNAYRSAHHQPSDVLLDLCDKLGILVFSETRRMSSAPEDIEQLRKVVKQGRNHASVFLWGIGNEEVYVQHQKETIKVTERLKREIRALDKTRCVTCAILCWDGKERYKYATKYFEVASRLDVMGFNYCDTAWDDYHEHFPEQPVIITEIDAANSSARGIYVTNESQGHFFTLDVNNPDKCTDSERVKKRYEIGERFWKNTANRKYLAGAFLWTGIDYRGEPSPMPWPAVSSTFGILDYCGFRKDSFYYYRCWWDGRPTIHLFPHWNNPVNPGEKLTVYAYSNMEEIELFVNGKSYGKKIPEKNWYLKWDDVTYEPGSLMAKGFFEGKEYTEEIVTTKNKYQLMVTKYSENLFSNDNISIWNIVVVDEDGRVIPDACPLVYIKPGKGSRLLGTGNGDPASHENETFCERHAFNGMLQAIISSETEPLIEAYIVEN